MPLFSGYFSIASFLPKLQDLGSYTSKPEWLEGHFSSGNLLVRFTLKLKNRLGKKKKSNTELKTKPSCRGPQGAAVGGETCQVDLRQSGSWASQCCHELPSCCLSSHCPMTEPLPRQLGFLISTGSTGIFTFSLLDSCGFQGIQVFAMSQEIHITSQAVLRPECAAAAWSPLAVTPVRPLLLKECVLFLCGHLGAKCNHLGRHHLAWKQCFTRHLLWPLCQ